MGACSCGRFFDSAVAPKRRNLRNAVTYAHARDDQCKSSLLYYGESMQSPRLWLACQNMKVHLVLQALVTYGSRQNGGFEDYTNSGQCRRADEIFYTRRRQQTEVLCGRSKRVGQSDCKTRKIISPQQHLTRHNGRNRVMIGRFTTDDQALRCQLALILAIRAASITMSRPKFDLPIGSTFARQFIIFMEN